MGTDTGAPATGRTLKGATSVLLMAFCVKSRRVSPELFATSHSQLTMLGTASPMRCEKFFHPRPGRRTSSPSRRES